MPTTTHSNRTSDQAVTGPGSASGARPTSRPVEAALVAAGALFVAYPAIRPFSDEETLDGAAAFASTSWLVAHSLAMVGFVLLGLAAFGVARRLDGTSVAPLAGRAAVVTAVGIGLTLPYYGAETFGLHVVGREAVDRGDASLVAMADSIRFGFGIVFITVGLLLVAVGAGMLARAVWRSACLDRWSAVPLAVAFALYLPQYSTPQPARVAHGVLVLAGCLVLARALRRAERAPRGIGDPKLSMSVYRRPDRRPSLRPGGTTGVDHRTRTT